jgi:hypothetical protein
MTAMAHEPLDAFMTFFLRIEASPS